MSVGTKLRNAPPALRWLGESTERAGWETWAACIYVVLFCVVQGKALRQGPSSVVCKHACLFMCAPYQVYTVHREEIALKRFIVSHMRPPDILRVSVTSMHKCVYMFVSASVCTRVNFFNTFRHVVMVCSEYADLTSHPDIESLPVMCVMSRNMLRSCLDNLRLERTLDTQM